MRRAALHKRVGTKEAEAEHKKTLQEWDRVTKSGGKPLSPLG